MKKMQKVMSVILSLAMGLSVFSLAACNNDPEDKKNPDENPNPPVTHTHTFDMNKWESDETQHWHPATCEHKTEKNGVADHDDNGTDGGCSICGRPHTHTFSSEWTYDQEERPGKHWHAATCIHFDLIDGEADHEMENGVCKVCGYAEHVHTFATEWSTSDYAHWHAATCTGENEGDVKLVAKDSGRHTYDSSYKCTVCGYQHTHPVASTWAVDAESHWHVWECEHEALSMTGKPDKAAHDTDGKNGSCSVCGWLPLVDEPVKDAEGNVTNGHVHSFQWQYSAYYHWKRIKCDWLKNNGCKSCDKGYYADTPKNYDWGEHVFNEQGVCECGYNKNSWRYGTDDCILCETCGGCIKTVCTHDGEEGHKKCGDNHGADAKHVILEAENAYLYKVDGSKAGISDYTGGKRDGIAVNNGVNVVYNITSNEATTVTLKILCTRRQDNFADGGTVYVNGTAVTTKTNMAQPSGEDAKCNPAWLTFGCIQLKEGENTIEIKPVGNGFNIDKIELITDASVTIGFTPINNDWLTDLGQYTPIPRAKEEEV